MTDTLTVTAIPPGRAAAAASPPASPVGVAATATVASATAPSATIAAWPNPSLQLDAALGVVVTRFHDDSGRITGSIPTEQQLKAYRAGAGTAAGTTGAGVGPHHAGTATAAPADRHAAPGPDVAAALAAADAAVRAVAG